MKKIFTLAAALLTSAIAFNASADKWEAKTASEFKTYWSGLASNTDPNKCDTIILAPATEGEIWNLGNIADGSSPTTGKVHVIGNTTEKGKLPGMMVGFNWTESNGLSLFFENVNLQYRTGNTATSGQIFYWNNAKSADLDSVVFRNCDINNIARSFWRVVPSSTLLAEKNPVGNYFEMSDCIIHDNMISSGNNWPLIYFGQIPIEVVVKNNTFYNMPYMKDLFQMNYIDPEITQEICFITFENNTILVGAQTGFSIVNTSNKLPYGSQVELNNNIILYPDWSDDLTMNPNDNNPYLVRGNNLMVSYTNNLVEGYRDWEAGNTKTEDGEYTWLNCTTIGNHTMASLGFAWDDFFDRENKDFSIERSNPAFAAELGDLNNYVDQFPSKIAVNVTIESSKTATVSIVPNKIFYVTGDEITVSIDLHGGLNTFKGWSDGSTETNRTFTLSEDINLVAYVEEEAYTLLWDFCNITANNQKIQTTMAANHTDNVDNPGAMGVRYFNGTAYADSSQFDSRNNKSKHNNGSLDDVLYRTPLRRTPVVDSNTNPAYFYINFSSKGMKTIEVSSYIMFEMQANKEQLLQWSTDLEGTWTTVTTTTLDSIEVGYVPVVATLPAEAENLDNVYVRWMGNPETEVMRTKDFDETSSMAEFAYEYIANIKVTAAEYEFSGVESVAAEAEGIAIAQNGNVVTVANAAAATVELYNVAGAQIVSVPAVGGVATVTLPAHGAYIVKAGKEAKVVVY